MNVYELKHTEIKTESTEIQRYMLNFSRLKIHGMERHERIAKAIRESGLKKQEVAKACGVANSAVTQWINGDSKSMKPENLFALAKLTGFSPKWLAIEEGPEVLDDESPLDGYELVPQLTAKAAMGNGYANDHVEVKGGLAFKREWLNRLHAPIGACSVIYAMGSSMEPTINDGEVVLINHEHQDPVDGRIYVLRRADGEVIIKRLVKQMTGWLIRSDNEDKRRYPDEPISPDGLQHVEILGRVIWRGGEL
ncbi:LexA family transcriptional regulator [Pseudomonas segetis]|uniref:Phage repressor protein C, contains Cro/C1-type HTH and peptisase s24 domains n=1 Tax=Pseudomonas segetis TaxID=298908 RepID=A0A239CAG5_9PSED|nr:S24 family peptidase [Pseudomonas segetis]SNS16343.1 Phage repressor protein C, contains Cro/C1-type HTH and peptisase s24 domains [Pseudomonas segetis]